MTREEQIKAAAEKEVPSTYERDGVRYDSNMWQSHQRIFIKGAQWSDAHPCFGVVDPIGSERSGSGVKSNEPSATDEEAAEAYAAESGVFYVDGRTDTVAKKDFIAGRQTLRASLKGDLEMLKVSIEALITTQKQEGLGALGASIVGPEALSILARLLGEK